MTALHLCFTFVQCGRNGTPFCGTIWYEAIYFFKTTDS